MLGRSVGCPLNGLRPSIVFSSVCSNDRESGEWMSFCNPYLAMGPERKFPRACFNRRMAGHDVMAVSGEAQNQFLSALQSQLIISHRKVSSSFIVQGLTP